MVSGLAGAAVDVLHLNPGPAWPEAVPWPAGDHTIPMMLPVPQAHAADDVTLTGTSIANGAIYGLVLRRNGRFTPAFDINAWRRMMVSESYRPEHALPISARLPFHYHRLPGVVRNALATLVLSLSRPRASGFPAHLFDCGPLLLIALVEADAAPEVVPTAVLTHDIDTAPALRWLDTIAAAEQDVGARSCWNIVPRHYEIDYSQLEHLVADGHEIGVHGIWHTNREAFLPRDALERELEALAGLRALFDIRTYRGPSWYRTQAMFDVLAGYFDVDLTALDVDLICPGGPGGVGLARPYAIRPGLIELPCTLPFEAPVLLGPRPNGLLDLWRPKIEMLKRSGGMVIVNTHPDPNYLGNPAMMAEYCALLAYLANNGWSFRLPRDIEEGETWSDPPTSNSPKSRTHTGGLSTGAS
jgi:hypothetical protein